MVQKKFFFLCIYVIAGVSSPNCGDKVEVQLLFMAFFIKLIYMPINEIEFDSMKIALSRLGKKTAALVKIAQEGDCSKPDYPGRGCELLERATRSAGQGGKRKSRKKRGKGSMMSRKKKHISARQPKPKYVDDAIKILKNDQTYLIADITERGRKIRNLALELEDNAKKGGKRKRKSRRKSKKRRRRRSKRRKSRRRRR